jgi:diadenosine tetraphosphate (Ap4A) HIT family hydrolase
LFCDIQSNDRKRIIAENNLAYAIRDGFPVTEGHTLFMPKRHVSDYFGLVQSEVNAINLLVQEQRTLLMASDSKIEGFNIGMNCGEVSGQTVFHCHVHLIPRRRGDVANPRGGVRHIIADKGFYERLYLYQCFCWHSFITQNFLVYYRYCQKWVDLFAADEKMIGIETASYIKGLHNLLGAHFDLRNYQKFNETIQVLEDFMQSPAIQQNRNNQIQTFIYLYTSRINSHFMTGTFTEGLELVPFIEEKLKEYELFLDRHRVLVFYYKIASLYFGSGQSEKSIDYLNKIINLKVDLRTDLQCYARLLHLIAHYEIGNFELLEYLLKSVYRFMYKLNNLSVVEEKIFGFLQSAFRFSPKQLKPKFESLLSELRPLEKSTTGNRAFMYLDIISWLESKIANQPVQEIIRKKYLAAIEVAGIEK